jgi:hypothetical protein
VVARFNHDTISHVHSDAHGNGNADARAHSGAADRYANTTPAPDVTSETRAHEATADQPAADQPAADQPAADQPAADQPTADQPTADQSTANAGPADGAATDRAPAQPNPWFLALAAQACPTRLDEGSFCTYLYQGQEAITEETTRNRLMWASLSITGRHNSIEVKRYGEE